MSEKKKQNNLEYDVKARKIKWYRCGICNYLYMETELTIKKDIGLICVNCERSMKELDDEQEEIETIMREEKKSKALP